MANTIKLFGAEIHVNNVEESTSCCTSRRSSKGGRWSEDEQRAFLIGLDKVGKGNWTRIAKEFVPTRTPTQVASHAQKYFDRQKENKVNKHKKRSVFDIDLDEESSNTRLQLLSKRAYNKKDHKEILNEESPISAMPIRYILPPNGSYACYEFNFMSISSTNATPVVRGASSQSSSASTDDLDLSL
uniref:Uncharacterized protein n=1 Tax=Solanum lycopersicum TaxID=4081 RepID=A0A3Q7H8W6_SOLLC|nr:transcription factor KUA1 [Solanum lycopersicum]